MSYICPYCHMVCFDDGHITTTYYLSYDHFGIMEISEDDQMPVVLSLSRCPNCRKISVSLSSYHRGRKEYKITPYSFPPDGAIDLPECIPNAICQDYLEAVSIVDLSPKASATLARRCLQGMIHDFWGIKEKNLNAEISALKGKIPAAQWEAIDALRKIGNIGAHMEKDINFVVDVEPDEAKKLLKLIELLFDKWYIARDDEKKLLSEIIRVSDEKEITRNNLDSPHADS